MSVLAAAGLLASGCLLTPPIMERPDDLDERLTYFVEDVTPTVGSPVLLDRFEGDTVEFGILEIRHADVDDEVAFAYFFDFGEGDELLVSSGELRVDQERTEEEGTTIYAPVLLEVDSCSAELAILDENDPLTIRLELRDEVPAEEFPQTLRQEFLDVVSWDVEVSLECQP